MSSRLSEQGLLDDALVGLQERFLQGDLLDLDGLNGLHASLQRSLVVTKPKVVVVDDPDEVLTALYRAYLAPRARGSRALTKGAVLDRVVDTLRQRGTKLRRGAYIDDFIFDVVIESVRAPTVLEVLSFAAPRKDGAPIERDAGHFLYGISRLGLLGRAVVQPPSSGNGSTKSYERVRRWFDREDVLVVSPEDLANRQLELDLLE